MCRYRVLVAVATVVVSAVAWALGGHGYVFQRLAKPPTRAAMIRAAGPCRPILPRLVGFKYALPDAGCAGWSRTELAKFARELARSIAVETTTESLADAAVLRLVAGRRDEAVALLERASSGSEVKAEVWSDLGASYLARALAEDSAIDLVRSLSATGKALRLRPELSEALYNHALALESLYLRNGAEEAWSRFLEAPGSTPWAEEAKKHLQDLADSGSGTDLSAIRQALQRSAFLGDERAIKEIVVSGPQTSRLVLEEEILAKWAAALEARKWDQASVLAGLARSIARTLEEATGDRLPIESVNAVAESSGNRQEALLEGHRIYRKALDAYSRFEIESARDGMQVASQKLRRGSSPFALWADFHLAVCDYHLKAFERTLRKLANLSQAAEANRYLTLHGRVAWIKGLAHAAQASPLRAKEALIPAVADFARAREIGNMASVESLLAGSYQHLGDDRRAWQHRRKALKAAVAYGDHTRLPAIFSDAARSLARGGETDVALILQEEALTMERRTADPVSIAEALWWRALINHQAGQTQAALTDLAEASRTASRITSEAIRSHLLAGLSATEGAAYRDREPRRAVAALTHALEFFSGKHYEFLLTEILLERGRAWLSLGELKLAEADFRRGIEEYERQRRRIDDAPQQVVFFDQAKEVFTDMVRLQWDLYHDTKAALAYSDWSKARTLLDAIEGGRNQATLQPALLLARLAQALPEDTAIVAFAFLESRLLTWTFVNGQVTAVERVWTQQDKAALGRLRRESRVGRNEIAFGSAAATTYQLLLGDLRPVLSGVTRLLFIPDGDLLTVPFAALLQPNGRFLVEDYEILVAPSVASLPELATRTAEAVAAQDFTSLVLGDPQPDPNSDLPKLLAAADEARGVAATYRRSVLLLDEAATYPALLANARSSDMLHLATHAISNPHNPASSGILLTAPDANSSSYVTASQIASLPLDRAPLVFLSACSTSFGSTTSLEGILDLARPFLAAGAHAVVATLWEIEDQAASDFANSFHHSFLQSHNAAAALRETQIFFLTSPDHTQRDPALWAAYQVIGVPATATKALM